VKKLAYFLSFVIVSVFLVHLVAGFISWNQYKDNIILTFREATGKELLVGGDIKLKLLPLPTIILTDVKVSNLDGAKDKYFFEGKLVEIELKFIELFKKKFIVKGIDFIEANVNFEILANQKKNWEFLTKRDRDFGESFSLKEINFVNSNLNFAYASDSKKVVSGVNANFAVNLLGDSLSGTGEFMYDGNKITFDNSVMFTLSASGYPFNFEANAVGATTKFKGHLMGVGLNWHLAGDMSATVSDHKIFTKYIAGASPALDMFSDKVLAHNIVLNGKVLISDKKIVSPKAKITGSGLEGYAKLSLAFGNTPTFETLFDFKSVDLDSLFVDSSGRKASNRMSGYGYDKKIDGKLINFDRVGDVNVTFTLDVGKLKVNEEIVKDLSFDFQINEGDFTINELSMVLPGDLDVKLYDAVNTVKETVTIYGRLKVVGKKANETMKWLGFAKHVELKNEAEKIAFKSLIKITPKIIYLTKIGGTLGSGSLKGEVALRVESKFDFAANIVANGLQLADFKTPAMNENLQDLLTSSEKVGYIAKYKWLRKFDSNAVIRLDISDSKYNEKKFNNVSAKIGIIRAKISAEEINLDTEIANFTGNASLDVRALKPLLEISLEGTKFDVNQVRDFIFGEKKQENSEEVNTAIAKKWSKDKFNLFRFDKFNGSIKLEFDELICKDLRFVDFDLSSRLHDESLYFDNFAGKIFDGDLIFRGNLGFAPEGPKLSMSYGFNNFVIERAIKLLTPNDNFFGRASISGSLFTKGDSPYEWARNINSNVALAARGVDIKGVNWKEIISLAAQLKDYKKEEVLGLANKAATSGDSEIISLDASLNAKDGTLSTKNVTFMSDYASGSIAASLSIKDWIINMEANTALLPVQGVDPIIIKTKISGFVDKYNRADEIDNLNNYLRNVYQLGKKEIEPEEIEKEFLKRSSKSLLEELETLDRK
jgi:uncharacterized protein involved in outer membrane biogenesis